MNIGLCKCSNGSCTTHFADDKVRTWSNRVFMFFNDFPGYEDFKEGCPRYVMHSRSQTEAISRRHSYPGAVFKFFGHDWWNYHWLKVLKHHLVNRATCQRNLVRFDPMESSLVDTRMGRMGFPRLTAFLYSTLRVMRTINRRCFTDRKPGLSILGIFPGVGVPKSVVLIPSLVTSAPGADF